MTIRHRNWIGNSIRACTGVFTSCVLRNIWVVVLVASNTEHGGLRWHQFMTNLYLFELWKVSYELPLLSSSQDTSDSVMVNEADSQTFTSMFDSHSVPYSYGLVPDISKKLCKFLLSNQHDVGVLFLFPSMSQIILSKMFKMIMNNFNKYI